MSHDELAPIAVLPAEDGPRPVPRTEDGRPDLQDGTRTEIHAPAWAGRLAARAKAAYWRVGARLWWLVLAARIVVLAVRGARRTIGAWWLWVTVEELSKALKKGGVDPVQTFERRAKARWFRLVLTLVVLVLISVLSALVVLVLVLWLAVPALAVPAVTGAALAGRKKGERLLGGVRKTVAVTGNAIIDAHRNAGIIGKDQNLEFRVPPTRDTTSDVLSAMQMVYDLPPGKTFDEVVRKSRSLASALRRPVEAIDLHEGEHAGQVDAWIAEKSPYKVPVPPWPWLDREEVDLFTEPVPQGVDLRGRAVRLPLLWTAALVSARPRRGKSFEVRKLGLAGGLDPYVRVVIINPKQSGDFRPLRAFAYRYVERDAKRTLAILRELERQMWAAYDILADLPVEVCPESKITRAIHRDPAIDVRLTLILIDEIQIPFEDEEHGEDIKEVLTTIAKVGPAAGFEVIAATQRPDGLVVPVGWRSVMGTRVALQVMTEGDSKIALGAHHCDRFDASRLPATPGVAIVAGDVEAHAAAPDGPRITRLHEVSTLAAQAICQRARARREELGLLDGDAAGDTAIGDGGAGVPELAEMDVLEMARAAFRSDAQLRSVELCERLDGVGLEMTPQRLAALLAPHDVHPVDIWAGKPPRSYKGYRSRDLLAALDRRARGARDPDVP